MGGIRLRRPAAATGGAEGAARPGAGAVLGRGAEGIVAGSRPRPARAHQVVAGLHGLSAGTGDRLVGVYADVRRGIEAGSRLPGEPVLGGDAVAAVLLLNGPLRDVARGRGPGRQGDHRADAPAGLGRLVVVFRG